MKRDLSVITDEVKDRLKKWLIYEDDQECPFQSPTKGSSCHICKSLLPKLPYERKTTCSDAVICPCNAYQKHYVVKMAKEFVK